jgi:hypothetical protein
MALVIAYSTRPGPGEWQGRRGGKSHDAYTGVTHIIVGYGM